MSLSADSGVTVAGLRMTALPPAIAGPSLWATRLSGSLKGVMASTTPIGTPVVVAAPLLAARERVEGDGLAVEPLGLLGGDGQRVDAAPGLLARLADRLRALAGDGAAKSSSPVGHDGGGLEQNLCTLVGGHGAGGRGSRRPPRRARSPRRRASPRGRCRSPSRRTDRGRRWSLGGRPTAGEQHLHELPPDGEQIDEQREAGLAAAGAGTDDGHLAEGVGA